MVERIESIEEMVVELVASKNSCPESSFKRIKQKIDPSQSYFVTGTASKPTSHNLLLDNPHERSLRAVPKSQKIDRVTYMQKIMEI